MMKRLALVLRKPVGHYILPVVWLFIVAVSAFGFTALQNLIWFT